MTSLINMLILACGLFALIKGADMVVQQSARLAQRFSISPFFVGVVLLGMGTSAPEAGVSAFSSVKDLSHLAVGNVFGSNIFNILLVLGMVLFQPLSQKKIQSIRKDIGFLVLTGFMLGPLMWDLFLSRLEALFLSGLFFAYMALCYWTQGKKVPQELSQNTKSVKPMWLTVGMVSLLGGSYLTVMGAEGLGQNLGISERILGLLVVSVGTSLPEFVASWTAILKGHRDMAIGNIIGSNVFNTFFILSLAVWIRPAPLDIKMLALDLPALWFTHLLLLLLVFAYRQKWVQKSLPYVFLGSYVVFLLLLFLYTDGT